MSGTWSYQSKYVKCGNRRCKSCPHGPYWYRFQTVNRKTKCEYVGKTRPTVEALRPTEKPHPHDAIYDKSTASCRLAWEILCLPAGSTEGLARETYRGLCLIHHPDRGGDHKAFCRISAAWSYLRIFYGWK